MFLFSIPNGPIKTYCYYKSCLGDDLKTNTTPSSRLTMEQFKRKRQEMSYAKLNTLRNEAALCDVILKTTGGDGDEMYAHRCVIASNSEYFEKMFVGAEENGRKSIIHVDGVDNDALRHLIDFIYTGELVAIDAENVEGILNAAELLRLDDVRDVCTEFYTKTIDDENCLVVKDIADARVITDLSEKCLSHALKRLVSVSDCAAFLNADMKKITQLIENYDVRYADQEDNVGIRTYEAIMKWVKYDESDREHLLPELLSSIKLTSIPQNYFDQKIATEPLIKSNPKCMELISNTSEYLKCGGASSMQFTAVAPKAKKKRGMPRVKCTEPNTPCSGKIAIDLHAILSDSANDLQNTEWTLLMNEDNFLKEWDKEWEDVNGPWNEEYKHDW